MIDHTHDWKLFHRGLKRESVEIPPLLHPLLDHMLEQGHRPPSLGWVLELPDGQRHAGGDEMRLTPKRGHVYASRKTAQNAWENCQTRRHWTRGGWDDVHVPRAAELRLVPVWLMSVPALDDDCDGGL